MKQTSRAAQSKSKREGSTSTRAGASGTFETYLFFLQVPPMHLSSTMTFFVPYSRPALHFEVLLLRILYAVRALLRCTVPYPYYPVYPPQFNSYEPVSRVSNSLPPHHIHAVRASTSYPRTTYLSSKTTPIDYPRLSALLTVLRPTITTHGDSDPQTTSPRARDRGPGLSRLMMTTVPTRSEPHS